MRVNRFVFLNLPILSLGDHLGVTVSPQSPLPAGYVTLPVDDRPPPLGLMPFHSKGQGSDKIGSGEVETVKLHIDAMKLVIGGDMKGNGGKQGEQLLSGLQKVCDKLLS